MLITTQNEIISLMPTARWDRPEQLFGYLEEEESVALIPLLGDTLYQHVLKEYDRLRTTYTDITATTVRPTQKAKEDARLAYTDVTERLEQIKQGKYRETFTPPVEGEKDVPDKDMATIRLIRICQQIEFYKMLSHKAGLLTVSFNEGGGMNVVNGESYEPADEKRLERVAKDAFMSAGRAIDSLLLFLESDAKGAKLFLEKWKAADAFYLHKDLLFQTARVLNEYLDIKGERAAYVALVRDIRFCQNTYLKPRVGVKLLKEVVRFANEAVEPEEETEDGRYSEVMTELISLLRTALAFYVESRRTELMPAKEKLARRDSMTDAQQAMARACEYLEENLDDLGDAAVDSPIYKRKKEAEHQAAEDAKNIEAAQCRRRKEFCEQNHKKLFTMFPATHRTPEIK